MKGDRIPRGEERGKESRPSVKSIFAEYRAKILRRSDRARKAIVGHGIIFGAVNAFLLLINFLTGISFPWFLFPLGGWAILLSAHFALTRQHSRQSQEVSELDDLSTFQTDLLRRFHGQRSAFAVSSTTAVVTALFLGMTNLIVSPEFPWAVITAGSIGLVELAHSFLFSARRRSLLERISLDLPAGSAGHIGGKGPRRLGMKARNDGRVSEEYSAAQRMRERIAKQLTSFDGAHASLGQEIAALLDRYVEQIAELIRQRDEVAQLSRRAEPEAIERERERLLTRLAENPSETLSREYRRAADQLDAQLVSIKKLGEHFEIAELRLGSALNCLKQLEIDVVRMKGLPNFEESAVSKVLKERTSELSQYLEDLSKGQRELEDLH